MRPRTLVIASRTTLAMLLIAAVALLGLGLVSLVVGDPPEVEGWLRAVFGRVFGLVAIGLAAVLGTPAAIGLWAMAGATRGDAVPVLSPLTRRVLTGVSIATVAVTAIVCLVSGTEFAVLNMALFALVALASLGLAGATSFSPHRGRAALSAVALLAVTGGAVWVLVRAFLAPPR